MAPDPITEELRLEQVQRERTERVLADRAPEEDEVAQHERRAEKASYLKAKLEERARAEDDA